MEINKLVTETKNTIENPEGSIVFERNPQIQLYLEASNLNIKEDAFYQNASDKLKTFIEHLQNEKDSEYLEGLAKFLSSLGIKLSPVVISTLLANRGFSFRNKGFENIFNTPQRISEAIALSKEYKINNSFKKNVLKVALEGYHAYTLKKNKMESRKVKLKDLIKLLRPVPTNENISALYKSIIESSKESRLKDEDTLVSMKSSKNKTDAEKIQYYVDNIEKIPVNQLIRNLKFIVEKTNYKTQTDLLNKIITRLNSITDYRFLNIFDLIEASISVEKLEKPLHEITKKFVEKIKRDNALDFEEATVLFDLSGSMSGNGVNKGFKYLVLLSLLYNNIKMRAFDDSLWSENYDSLITNIKLGNLGGAFRKLRANGGTALVQSATELLNEDPSIKTLIVISDEVSWKEGEDLTLQIRELNNYLTNKKLVLINPVVYQGTVFTKNVVGIASLTSSIIIDMTIFDNPSKFIQYIKNYGKLATKNEN